MNHSFSWVQWGRFCRAALVLALVVAGSIPPARAEFKVALLLDRGGKDDKSFNTSAYEGASRARKELGIQLKYVEAPDDNAFEPMLTRAASVRHEVVFGTAWLDWNPDQVLRVAAGILRKQASDGMPRNTPGLLPEV